MLLRANKHIWHFQPEAVHRRFCCAYSSAGFSAGEQCFSLFICALFHFLTFLMVFFVNYFYLLFEETKKNETLANNLSLWLSTACDCGLSPFSRHSRPVGETSRGKTGWRKDYETIGKGKLSWSLYTGHRGFLAGFSPSLNFIV